MDKDGSNIAHPAREADSRVPVSQQVHVVRFPVELQQLAAPAQAYAGPLHPQLFKHLGRQAAVPVFRHKDNREL